MLLQVLFLVVAIIGLYYGAEFALDAAEKIGIYFGLSPLVIGLLIVGFGTSLPEFFVSHLACFRGHEPIALGNIIGSNIANTYLILGVSSVITTMYIVRREIIIQLVFHLVLIAMLVGVIVWYQKINLITLPLFMAFFGAFLWDTFRQMKKQREHLRHVDEKHPVPDVTATTYIKLLAGFVILYFSGELLVYSGSNLGTMWGISEYVISAIFVAFGTSFPELVTAILACAKKKNTDIITGNIIGSNIFNVSLVLGSLGIYEFTVESPYHQEMILLGISAVVLLALSALGRNLGRVWGVLLLGGYAYIVVTWLRMPS